MRILILGADGYLGWPTSMHFAARGYEVWAVDNFLRRKLCEEEKSTPLFAVPEISERVELFSSLTKGEINFQECDLTDYEQMRELFTVAKPDCVIHYAEQPSAPYSMKDYASAHLTLRNNLETTFNCIWAVKELAPNCHIIKLGTMGEYGTPNIDIEEGWIDISHNGRSDKFLYPRAAGSLYHTTKVLDTDLLWFYVRTYGIRVTDLMQGPVYGFMTPESRMADELLPIFNYDDIFGTVLNRFLVQAVAKVPLTVYGTGGQTRGYLNLIDTMQCVRLAVENPAAPGELRIMNQFTETLSVNEIAKRVHAAGEQLDLNVSIQTLDNPRKEKESHYYNPKHSKLTQLGLSPTLLSQEVLIEMLQKISQYKDHIDHDIIAPRVRWS